MSKILIVEDNAESRYMLESLLEAKGHEIITAEHGEEALRLARQEPPEVIISDIMMPVMNGFRLCREVKNDSRLRTLPFIFYTATFVEKADEKLAMSLGASRFVIKPTEGEQFIQILDEVLDEHRHRTLPVPEKPLEADDTLLDMYDHSITRKLAETVEKLQKERKALLESELRLKEAQEIGQMGHWKLDLRTNSVYWSDEIYRILGLKPQEFDASYEAFLAAIHPDDRAFVNQAYQDALVKKTQYDIDHRLLLKDGIVKYVQERCQTLYDDDGQAICSMGTVQDITERKQAEEALRQSQELLTALFDTAKDNIFIKDSELKYKKINPAMERLLDKSSKEVIDKTDSDLFGKEAGMHILEVDKRVLKGKTVEEFLTKPVGGAIRFFHTIKVPLTNSKGKVTGLCGIARDITEQKLAEQEKIKAQKIVGEQKRLALIGQVAGKMAHDFNNIMGIIMGNTELSLMDCKDIEIKKTLKLIFDQTLRGKNLTKNLIAFAKTQEPKQEFFGINEKIDLVIRLLKKDIEGIELIREDKPSVPDLLADPGMIEHALVNLVQNSTHAVSLVEHPKIMIRTYSLDGNICFEIEDNGCGIPDESLDNIYDPSFTLKGSRDITGSYKTGIKGTGYGMSNVKKYIEQHKGNISVESKFGSGTKFTINIPVIEKQLTKEEKTKIREEIEHFEKYILLVEDEIAISDVQYRILTQDPCNHKVDIANNGQIAMDMFDRNQYDFVSLDYVLPGKANGMDVYHHIRKTNKIIPILFISGNLDFLESVKDLKQKDTYIEHLSKPCQNKDYINCINRLMTQN